MIDVIKGTIYNISKLMYNKELILVKWWSYKSNFGDSLNPVIVEHISGRKPLMSNYLINLNNKPVYSVIGSILDNSSDENLVVWGSGFMCSSGIFVKKPKKICAVRGPLSRDLCIKQGIYCPEIYGDPALLYPSIYKPSVEKKYKLGIIPHYFDKEDSILNLFKKDPHILIIDILDEVNNVVDDICRCERIASSSLHGIIAADAYGIPSIWIKFSDKVGGDGFKFHDYFMSVGRTDNMPLLITKNTTFKDIYNEFYEYRISIDLDKLLKACPFKAENGSKKRQTF